MSCSSSISVQNDEIRVILEDNYSNLVENCHLQLYELEKLIKKGKGNDYILKKIERRIEFETSILPQVGGHPNLLKGCLLPYLNDYYELARIIHTKRRKLSIFFSKVASFLESPESESSFSLAEEKRGLIKKIGSRISRFEKLLMQISDKVVCNCEACNTFKKECNSVSPPYFTQMQYIVVKICEMAYSLTISDDLKNNPIFLMRVWKCRECLLTDIKIYGEDLSRLRLLTNKGRRERFSPKALNRVEGESQITQAK